MIYTIYAVIDPASQDPIYIGCTRQSLKQRMSGHKSDACKDSFYTSTSSFHTWLKTQIEKGIRPSIIAITSHDDFVVARDLEIGITRTLKSIGIKLLNEKTEYLSKEQTWKLSA